MSVAKYLFGGKTGETQDSLKRKRRLAEAMIGSMNAPKDVGSGLSAIGQALLYRSLMGDIKSGEAASAADGAKAFQSGLTGGEFPAAPGKSDNVVKALFGMKDEADTSRTGSTIDFARAADDAAPNGDYYSAIRSAESGGNDSAKNPRSSALGRYQFIDSTWQNLAKKYPDLGLTPDGRTDPAQQERAIKAFTADNAAVLQSAGIEPTGGNLYAAHFLGADGARNVLQSDPNASVASIVGNQVVKANPFLNGMSVAQFQQWAAKKGGGNGPVNLGGNKQVASLDPSAGLPEFDQYANIPAVDGMGQDQRAKFRAWNSDPAGNEAQNMQGIDPALSKVVERAKQIAGTNFVLGSGRRDQDQQKTAIANGWSGTMDSDHLTGGAADLWPVDENGAVVFDPQKQAQIVQAMKQAAGELGLDMEAGADWKRKDMPHFGMTNQTPMDNAPVPTPRPAGNQVASLDPSIGMPPPNAQPAQQQTAGIFVGTPEEMAAQNQPRIPAQMLDPRAMGGPQEGFGMPQQAPQQPAQAPQPQQVAQSSQMSDMDALAALGAQNANAPASRMRDLQMALSNPNLSEQQQTILANELQRVQQESDPQRQMQLEKARLELEQARNPAADYDFVTGRDGSIFRTDNRGNMEQVYGGKPETYRTLTAEEKMAAGLPVEGAYQVGPDAKISQIGGGGTTVNIDQKTEGAFDKKLAEKQAETFDTMATEGINARADLAVIDELGSLLQGTGGTMDGLSGTLAKYGIGGEGISDIQAAQALISKLVPTQRQPGSGSMSDRDVELFTRSLPSLWNAPGGNEKILGVMRGLTGYKQAQGEIADQVLAGEITRQEARQLLRKLPNPLEGFKAPAGGPNETTLPAAEPASGNVSRPKSKEEFDALLPGTQFEAPDGSIRVKP